MTRKAPWLIAIALLLSVILRGNSDTQSPLIAIDPWVNMRVPVVANDVVIVGFLVKNIGDKPIELLEGRYRSISNNVTLQEVWVSETIGCLSGPFDEISSKWNEGLSPTGIHGYLLDPAQSIGVAYIFSVRDVGNHSITMLGITYKNQLSSRIHKWAVNDFNRLVMDVKLQASFAD